MREYLLVVDRNPSVRVSLQEFLEGNSYSVKLAESGAECLKCSFSKDRPSLIVLDTKMQGLTGIEILTLLKADERTEHVPVIMITEEQGIEEQALNSGAYALLYKPLDEQQLLTKIRGALGHE